MALVLVVALLALVLVLVAVGVRSRQTLPDREANLATGACLSLTFGLAVAALLTRTPLAAWLLLSAYALASLLVFARGDVGLMLPADLRADLDRDRKHELRRRQNRVFWLVTAWLVVSITSYVVLGGSLPGD